MVGYPLEDFEFDTNTPVIKFTGDAQYEGVIVARYHTMKGKARYVVEVSPQGFQMIVSGSQIREVENEAKD